jgi:hypothetical protein
VHEAPASEWAPFATDDRPTLDGDRSVLGAAPVGGGIGARAGAVAGARALPLRGAAAGPGLRLRPPLGSALRLRATDYLDARTRGFIELDGERLEIDARGPLSVHHGLRLTRYAYAAAVPPGADGPRLISATSRPGRARVAGPLSGGAAVTYAFGAQGLPTRSLHLGRPRRDLLLAGGRRLILEEVRAFPHVLLGEPTVTALARGRLEARGRDQGALTLVLDKPRRALRLLAGRRGRLTSLVHGAEGPGRRHQRARTRRARAIVPRPREALGLVGGAIARAQQTVVVRSETRWRRARSGQCACPVYAGAAAFLTGPAPALRAHSMPAWSAVTSAALSARL